MIIRGKKKISISLIVAMIAILLFSISIEIYATTDGSGELGTSGLTWTYTVADNTLRISGVGEMPDYTSSNKPPYSGKRFKTVVFESDTITTIGNYAFYGNTYLETIDVGNVMKIGDYAFYNTSSLKNVISKGSLETIGEYSFSRSKITSLELPEGLKRIGSNAFNNCSELNSITIPSTIQNIGQRVFEGCRNLSNIENNSQTAFIMDKIVFGSVAGNTHTGYQALNKTATAYDINTYWVDSLKALGYTITSLGPGIGEGQVSPYMGDYSAPGSNVSYTYNEYTGITRVYGVGAMKDNPSSYRQIPIGKKIEVEEGVTSIGKNVFTGSTGSGNYANSTVTEILLPETLTFIGENAFYQLSALESIDIPAKVASIGKSAFHNNSSLKTITGMEGVETIGDSAFYSCNVLTSLPTMDSLRTIDSKAFYYSQVETLNAPLLEAVGDNAFYQNDAKKGKLTTVYAPKLNTIGKQGFYNQGQLLNVSISDNANIGLNAFYGTPIHSSYYSELVVEIGKVNLSDVKIKYNDYSGQANIYGNGEMRDFTISSSQNLVGTYSSGYPITSILIEEGVTNIGKEAFYYSSSYFNNKITSVEIADTVTNIGENAFRSQTNLQTIKNYATSAQIVGQNILNGAGSNVVVENREVYAYSTNENFIVAVQGYTSNPYTIITLDNKELNPLETSLEDWVQAGNSAESWIDAGNTVEDYINNGGTANSWGELLGSHATYLWQRADGTTNSWTKYGGNAISWGSYGGSPTSWAEAGGTLGSWEEAGGDVEEYQAEVPEEDGEDDENYKDMILVYVDETLVNFPDVKPSVSNERILVPVRFVMQQLGFEVNWDDLNKKAVMRLVESDGNKIEIEMRPNQSTMLVNGKTYLLETPLQVASPGRLMLPGGELVKTMQDIYYKEEKPAMATYEGYYSSEDIAGAEPKLKDIPTIEEFTDNPNLIPLTPENEESILENEVSMTDILLTAEPTNFRATVPFKVEVYMDKYGVKTIGQGYKIVNECPLGQIVIVDFKVTPVSGWTLVDISDNFKTKKINTKEFGLSVNGSTALSNLVPLNTSLSEPIRNGESKDLEFDVELAGQTAEVNQVISSLSIVLDFWK